MNQTEEISKKVSRWIDQNKPVKLGLESAIIGAVLLESSTMPRLADILQPKHFSDQNKQYWDTLLSMLDSTPIDLKTFAHRQAVRHPERDIKHVVDDLILYISSLNSSANVETYAYMLLEHGVVAYFLHLYTTHVANKKVAAFAEDILEVLLVSDDKMKELSDFTGFLKGLLPDEEFTKSLVDFENSQYSRAMTIRKRECIRVNINNLLALNNQKPDSATDTLTSILISLINNPNQTQDFINSVFALKRQINI